MTRFKQFLNEGEYNFKLFYNNAKKKYGDPITLGKFIGNGKTHDCDKNSFKHRKEYDLYTGEIVRRKVKFYDGSRIFHIFNVDKKTGKVIEFTPVDIDIDEKEWKENYIYFGKKLPKNVKLKNIWNY